MSDARKSVRTLFEGLGSLGIGFLVASLLLSFRRPDPASTDPKLCRTWQEAPPQTTKQALLSPSEQEPFWQSYRSNKLKGGHSVSFLSENDFDGTQPMAYNKTNFSSPLDPVFFLQQPQRVVQMFRDCENDPHCYIAYHHVPKTGGTSIEYALFRIFGQPTQSSCCNEPLLETFRANPEQFCNLKFTSWQMDYPYFFEVLDTCFERDNVQHKQQQQQQGGKHQEPTPLPQRRVLILVTFREPISTALSFIHQKCNKNLDKRTSLVQEACQTCHYESHKEIWDRFQRRVVAELEGAWHVMRLLQTPTADPEMIQAEHMGAERTQATHFHFPTERMQLAVMEPNDISQFLQAWHPEQEFSPANPETLDVCYFRLPLEYIAKLAPAAEWYRRFVAGVA